MGPSESGFSAESRDRRDPRAWRGVLARWLRRRHEASAALDVGRPPVARFRNIAISREAGAGGGLLAREVGTRLGWKVYDHELLEGIANRMEVPIEEARTYDELAPSVIQDWLLPLGEEHYAPHEAYLDHLAKLVASIGRSGDSILVGRGAGFLLPREETLTVRVVAPLKFRAQRYGERMGLTHRTARRAVRELDRRSRKFARVMYRINADDPHQYDLVLDTHSLGINIAAEVLVRAIEAGQPACAIATERNGGVGP